MVLDWSDMKELPWGVLLLFGGGLSMAAGLQITECGQIISANAGILAGLPRWAVLIGVSLLVMLASNFTSNTALAATLMPLLASAAVPTVSYTHLVFSAPISEGRTHAVHGARLI